MATRTPLKYDFGTEFNYATWTENTTLTLVTVNWNSDYRDIVRMDNQAALDAWINAQSGKRVIENVSVAKFQRNVRINVPINTALQYNYLRASNPAQAGIGDIQRNYYYFVQNAEYIAGNTTELTLQLDMWQTFGYDIEFGLCFAERGHMAIANENAFNNYGRDYLTNPEGIDVGGEYRIVKTARETVMDVNTANTLYSVLVGSTVDLTAAAGTVKAPVIKPAKGSSVDGISTGTSFYVFPTGADFTNFMKSYKDFPWVTQNIISATIIPNIRRYFPDATLTDVAADVENAVALPGDGGVVIVNPPDFAMYNYPAGLTQRKSYALAADWRDAVLNIIPTEYRILKKLLTYPYCLVELTTWTGKALVARPEVWADDDATIVEQAAMLPPGQRIAFIPRRYNGDAATTAVDDDDNGEWLDFATTIDSFVNVPVVNNQALNFLAMNKNGLAYQFQSADWSQQRAMIGAGAGYSNANADLSNQKRQAGIANRATAAQAELSSQTMLNANAIGVAGGMVGGGMSTAANPSNPMGLAGGITGGATSALQAGVQADAINQGGNISRTARSASTASSVQAGASIRDTNYDLASQAAQGDYETQVAGINAKIQDARLTQPSISGQFGGDSMNLVHSNSEISARFKLIDGAAIQRIGNYWLRYGYSIDRFVMMPTDLMCMSKFTYWKLAETYIKRSPIPELFKQGIRGIFEKGVTVWGDPDDIGVTLLSDNQPKAGITY